MLSATEARSLKDSKLQFRKTNKRIHMHEAMIKGVFLHASKVSGPSPGVGHRKKNLRTTVVEKSGPSPGEGHK
ncbi:hypothetical protein PTKIN_Ptkin10aG0126300 [Pterospermum kingtungense]